MQNKCFFIDVQGTLIDDANKTPISGCLDFIEYLNENNLPYMLITNNSKTSSETFLQSLQDKGFALSTENYIDPLLVMKDVITDKKIAAYGTESFFELLEQMGYVLDYENPESVVVGIKHDYSSEDFAQMIKFILQGAKLYGMHANTIYAKNGKRYPGIGSILTMLEKATSCSFGVVGKPSRSFYEKALEKLNATSNIKYDFSDITIISDDIKGDIVGAKTLGMEGVFVLSGKYQKAEEILPFFNTNRAARQCLSRYW